MRKAIYKTVSKKDRFAIAADLKTVDDGATESEAKQPWQTLKASCLCNRSIGERWDKQYPAISKSWLNY